jgi:hypothetical protein
MLDRAISIEIMTALDKTALVVIVLAFLFKVVGEPA